MIRPLWRFALAWRYRLFERQRYDQPALEWVEGQPLLVLPQVFNPRLLRSGEFLVRNLNERLIPPGSRVLDMGTGSGVGALVAARWADRVVAVDINPEAVRCARINVALSRREERIEVREGDLFGPVQGERFDVVLFNPPYYRGTPQSPLDQAWRSTDVVERFAAGLRAHLTPGGHALVVLSTDGEQGAFLSAFRDRGLAVQVVARRDLVNEVLTVYRLC